MRLIKLALISFIFLFLLITGISLFFPSHIRISKAINIKAGKDSIMAQISDAAKWKNWYPGLDTAKLLYVEGKVKGVILGNSDSLHPVYIIITGEKQDEINAQLISKKLRPVINGWKTISYPAGDSITLQWYMDFDLRWYPWEKFGSLLLEQSYGTKMERGLLNLRKLVQQ
jgi:Polyketide cyclase / dehydrase and lipid transport